MLRVFVFFMLISHAAAIYKIQGHLVCHDTDKITTDDASSDVWVQLYYTERDSMQTFCSPFYVGGHEYDSADKVRIGTAKGLECINQCINYNYHGNMINAVTFYHAQVGCYCVKEKHFTTRAGMSTCEFKYENDYTLLRRALHDHRVTPNGRQIHALTNNDNFIHLEGAAGRTDNALNLMVKVTNANCRKGPYLMTKLTDSCWEGCDRSPGPCPQYCGVNGYCCSGNPEYSGDCAAELNAVASNDGHHCVNDGKAPQARDVPETTLKTKLEDEGVQVTESIIMGKTSWGDWTSEKMCKDGVTGFELRVDSGGGETYDDTALNGIKLRCSKGGATPTISGHWGAWKGLKECSSGHHIMAFSVRSEASRGTGDDYSASDVRMRCNDGKELDGGGEPWGSWEAYRTCPDGSYFCGVEALMDPVHGHGSIVDDTSLNQIKFICCTAPTDSNDGDMGRVVPVGRMVIKPETQTSSGSGAVMKVYTRSENTGLWSRCANFAFTDTAEWTVSCGRRAEARYVRIIRPSARSQSEFTVQAYEAEPNMAFRKPVVCSDKAASCNVDKAVDGNLDTYSTSRHHLRVDLKELITIDKVIIHFNGPYYKAHASTSMQVLTNAGGNINRWTLCKQIAVSNPADQSIVVKEVTCDTPTMARRVKISNGASSVVVNELEVTEANVKWFRPPYDCFDNLTPGFGCKDLTFELDTGVVTKERWAGAKTHKQQEVETPAEHEVYYRLWHKMLNGPLYAGLDYYEGKGNIPLADRNRVARVRSEINDDREYDRISEGGDVQLWRFELHHSVHGKNYYKITSKSTGGRMYAVLSKTSWDASRPTDHYAGVEKSMPPSLITADEYLWELLKQDDGYYTIMNRKNNKPLFPNKAVNHYARVADVSADYKYDGGELWDLRKV